MQLPRGLQWRIFWNMLMELLTLQFQKCTYKRLSTCKLQEVKFVFLFGSPDDQKVWLRTPGCSAYHRAHDRLGERESECVCVRVRVTTPVNVAWTLRLIPTPCCESARTNVSCLIVPLPLFSQGIPPHAVLLLALVNDGIRIKDLRFQIKCTWIHPLPSGLIAI